MVDTAKLDRFLTNLNAYAESLRRLARMPRQEFLQQPDKIGNAKYHFVIAIECRLDTAKHIIATEGFRPAKDSADSFTVLAENGVIPEGKLDALRAMSRFRDRLIRH